MRKITDITLEEVIDLIKLTTIYREDIEYKIKILPIGSAVEVQNLKKWVRVYYEKLYYDTCMCCHGVPNSSYERILFTLRDDDRVIYFSSKSEKFSNNVVEKIKQYLIRKNFDLKIKKQ